MPTLAISEIKNPDQVKAWIDAGEVIELREGSQILGRFLPEPGLHDRKQLVPSTDKWPDFEALARDISEGKVLPGADLLIEERGRY
jgi:hypothetical protein